MRFASIQIRRLTALALLGACTSSPADPSETAGPILLLVLPSRATLSGGHSLHMRVTARQTDGSEIAPTDISWFSTDARIASVLPDGIVTGRSDGTVEIVARWNGVKGVAQVNVITQREAPRPCAEPDGLGGQVSALKADKCPSPGPLE
ncbi:MAG: Ig-like domain-containing protein [Gemmatimonadales bacterium]|nr:Ig-like domain-containing protein [Gemmatimonadales bacterium]MBA3556346.1 Ig-like domain-containing protein [Gemmatimonadales bacterium]